MKRSLCLLFWIVVGCGSESADLYCDEGAVVGVPFPVAAGLTIISGGIEAPCFEMAGSAPCHSGRDRRLEPLAIDSVRCAPPVLCTQDARDQLVWLTADRAGALHVDVTAHDESHSYELSADVTVHAVSEITLTCDEEPYGRDTDGLLVGEKRECVANLIDENDQPVSLASSAIAYASSDQEVATFVPASSVTEQALTLTARGEGTATLSASAGVYSTTFQVSVFDRTSITAIGFVRMNDRAVATDRSPLLTHVVEDVSRPIDLDVIGLTAEGRRVRLQDYDLQVSPACDAAVTEPTHRIVVTARDAGTCVLELEAGALTASLEAEFLR